MHRQLTGSPYRLPKITLGLWHQASLSAGLEVRIRSVAEAAMNHELPLIDCADNYCQGTALAIATRIAAATTSLQLSVSLPHAGRTDKRIVEFLALHENIIDQLRIISIRPEGADGISDLPRLTTTIQPLAPKSAICIANTAPPLGILLLEQIRQRFRGPLMLALPCNIYTMKVNRAFAPAVQKLGASVLGYGALLGGRRRVAPITAYTYGRYASPEEEATRTDLELRNDVSEIIQHEWISTLIVGVQDVGQIPFWGRINSE